MVVTNRLLGGIFRAIESAGPACGADPVDEYRELAMLAQAWEHGTLEPRAATRAAGRVDDAAEVSSRLPVPGRLAAPDR